MNHARNRTQNARRSCCGPDGPLNGIDETRPFFQAMLAEFCKPGTTFSMKIRSVVGEFSYVVWTAETADNVYEMGTDTQVVRDGKIVAQSFAGKIAPKQARPSGATA